MSALRSCEHARAAQRLQIADPVAANKFGTGGAVEDPQREQQVISATAADGAQRGIDPDYVGEVFRRQIDATVGVEYALFASSTTSTAGR